MEIALDFSHPILVALFFRLSSDFIPLPPASGCLFLPFLNYNFSFRHFKPYFFERIKTVFGYLLSPPMFLTTTLLLFFLRTHPKLNFDSLLAVVVFFFLLLVFFHTDYPSKRPALFLLAIFTHLFPPFPAFTTLPHTQIPTPRSPRVTE